MVSSYKEAGVDIEAGERFAQFISRIKSNAISSSLGGFAGGVEIDLSRYKNPMIFSCTDGVGTKLLVAKKLGIFDTIGIDLVAMSVNDLIVCGVSPISFLDYIACGKINQELLHSIIKGIVTGCEQAECELSGGETAEMPDLYKDDDFDLAGFAVGVGEKSLILPKKERINCGDVVLALASSGIHSNGLSLARKVLEGCEDKIWEMALTPTKIYVKELKKLFETNAIKAAAHITGGGLESNFARVMPTNLVANFSWDWHYHEIFDIIQKRGNVATSEMRKVFNMGIGVALVVAKEDVAIVNEVAAKNNFSLFQIGQIVTA